MTYWAVAVAHAHIAFNVQRWAASETESLHISENLRFVQSRISPSTSEATN